MKYLLCDTSWIIVGKFKHTKMKSVRFCRRLGRGLAQTDSPGRCLFWEPNFFGFCLFQVALSLSVTIHFPSTFASVSLDDKTRPNKYSSRRSRRKTQRMSLLPSHLVECTRRQMEISAKNAVCMFLPNHLWLCVACTWKVIPNEAIPLKLGALQAHSFHLEIISRKLCKWKWIWNRLSINPKRLFSIQKSERGRQRIASDQKKQRKNAKPFSTGLSTN